MRVRGHALKKERQLWLCRCGEKICTIASSREVARDIYRFHLLDVIQRAQVSIRSDEERKRLQWTAL